MIAQSVTNSNQSAVSPYGKRPVIETPTALGPTSMRQSALTEFSPTVECRTCGRDDFESEYGLKQHHSKAHGEPLNKVTKRCKQCGEEYSPRPYRADESNFCSHECNGAWKSDNWQKDGHFRYRPRVTLNCIVCGDEYTAQAYRADESYCCSYECSGVHHSQRFSGQNHWDWRGGKSIYDAVKKCVSDESWNKTRQKVRDRFNNACMMCGYSPDSHGANVHHIIPILAGGTNAEELLIPLCNSCHGKVEQRTRKLLDPVLIE